MMQEDNMFHIDEQLDSDETSRIISHLYALGYLDTSDTTWSDLVTTEFESSFFATIYSLIYHSRKPLTEILRDEFNKLESTSRKAFQYICCFHQYNLPINLELLVRTLESSYEDFYDGVLPKTEGIIFEEQDSAGNLLYSTHHRIVAERIANMFFGDVKEQKALFLDLLRKARLSNEKEKDLVEKLMIRYLGPRSPPSKFTLVDKRQFFEVVCEKNPVATVLHHYGILETDASNFEKAEKLLKQALVSRRDALAGESDRNILTSLGRLYSKLGQSLIDKGNVIEAEQNFAKAEETFQRARFAGAPNGYPYHAHATMYRERADLTSDSAERLELFGRALDVLQAAEDNLNPAELQPIVELKTLIYSQIGDANNAKQSIQVLKEKFHNAVGYTIYGNILHREAIEAPNQTVREQRLREALTIADQGLKDFPTDEACARLRAKVISELDPRDLSRRYDALKTWYNISGSRRPNLWLLFQLGVISFALDYHYDSQKYFRELDRSSVGHRLRFKEIYMDEITGVKRRSEGTVISIENMYRGYIECTAAGSVRYRVYFRPIKCNFTYSSSKGPRIVQRRIYVPGCGSSRYSKALDGKAAAPSRCDASSKSSWL